MIYTGSVIEPYIYFPCTSDKIDSRTDFAFHLKTPPHKKMLQCLKYPALGWVMHIDHHYVNEFINFLVRISAFAKRLYWFCVLPAIISIMQPEEEYLHTEIGVSLVVFRISHFLQQKQRHTSAVMRFYFYNLYTRNNRHTFFWQFLTGKWQPGCLRKNWRGLIAAIRGISPESSDNFDMK